MNPAVAMLLTIRDTIIGAMLVLIHIFLIPVLLQLYRPAAGTATARGLSRHGGDANCGLI
jgi:hypothetical protein